MQKALNLVDNLLTRVELAIIAALSMAALMLGTAQVAVRVQRRLHLVGCFFSC